VTVAVKICGLTRVADAVAALEAGADYLGLNFWPGSKRHVSAETAVEIAAAVAGRARLVGVFVNAAAEEIDALAARVPLDLVQLHGDESVDFCRRFAARAIRAVRVASAADLAGAHDHPAALLLLDSHTPGYGGSGQRFDWSLCAGLDRPFFLAGGLSPDNVAAAVRVARPFGVDVAGGVEAAPGRKDPALVRRFVAAAKGLSDT
jgi:phosphoribosylanthranilate isomerase